MIGAADLPVLGRIRYVRLDTYAHGTRRPYDEPQPIGRIHIRMSAIRSQGRIRTADIPLGWDFLKEVNMERKFSDETEKKICGLYFKETLSSRQLGKRYGCDHVLIQRAIKRQGFKLRTLSQAMSLALMGKYRIRNNNWRGGRNSCNGYVRVYPSYFLPFDNRIMEHRLAMETYLSRCLKQGETVHHINENRSDNRIENLKLFKSIWEHLYWHRKKKRIVRFANIIKQITNIRENNLAK